MCLHDSIVAAVVSYFEYCTSVSLSERYSEFREVDLNIYIELHNMRGSFSIIGDLKNCCRGKWRFQGIKVGNEMENDRSGRMLTRLRLSKIGTLILYNYFMRYCDISPLERPEIIALAVK